jgi:serine/threonine protein kinase HipA of HipAB toxin-antitoxin module
VSYDLGYFANVASIEFAADKPLRDARAFSVDIPVDLEDRRYATWPAFLLDLLPQGHQRERIILAAETPYLAIAREFGLNVHADAQYGDGVFVVPRFDRAVIDGHVIRYGQESMTSAAGIAAFGHTDSHENYLRILRNVSADRRPTAQPLVLDRINHPDTQIGRIG